MEDRDVEREVEERNAENEAYIDVHYGNSYGPRRRYHWEAICGQLTLVED